ncbi:GFA family protein [Rhodobacterales bacterium HKCCE4037]|nr:GFA family protein [Rhodobacterales bacterium HKCCE4037]
MLIGRCDCGQVRFTVEDTRPEVTMCHCGQCRRTSGHHWASTHAPFDKLTFQSDAGLKWYESSDWAKRGFCGNCGSSLFYRMNDEDGIGIAAGCLDGPTGMTVSKHIFVAHKGDYYEIGDGKPQIETY